MYSKQKVETLTYHEARIFAKYAEHYLNRKVKCRFEKVLIKNLECYDEESETIETYDFSWSRNNLVEAQLIPF